MFMLGNLICFFFLNFWKRYAPLSIRLIEYLQQIGWEKPDERSNIFKLLNGIYFNETQETASISENPIDLIFFVGGITSTEISSIRLLNKKFGNRFLIATTKIITGETMLHELK